MKSKDDKCTTEGVHEQCDNNIYKLASRMPFCHIRSNKDFNPNYSENAAGNLVDVTYIHDHVKNIICDNNEELYKYILSWFSYKIQVPKGKTGIALVITEAEGSRKNVFSDILCDLLRAYVNRNVNHIENIVGKFNASLENKKHKVCNELSTYIVSIP